MSNSERDVPEDEESPATWENVVAGEIKEVIGHLLRDDALAEEGKEQVELARELRQERDDDQPSA